MAEMTGVRGRLISFRLISLFFQRTAKTWRKTDAYLGTVMKLEVFLMKIDRDNSPPLFFRYPQLPRTRVIMTSNDN